MHPIKNTNTNEKENATIFIVRDVEDDYTIGAYFSRKKAITTLYNSICNLESFLEDYDDYIGGLANDATPMSRFAYCEEYADEYADVYRLEIISVE